MQKVGILYICTGQYNMFWKGFFETAEQFMLKNLPYEIHYHVFSDDNSLPYLNHERVHYHFQEKQGWPWPTLLRFRSFYSIKDELTDYDYLYFFNSNIEFVAPVTEDIIPPSGKNFTFTHHFAYYQKPEHTHTYDRNPQCTAYIALGTGKHYVSGGCLGGRAKPFLEMSAILDHRIKADLKNNIIALWHDESQINKFVLGRTDIHFIHPGYFYPEIFTLDFPMICKVLEKYKYFPVAKFKSKTKEEKKKEWYQKNIIDRFFKPRKGSKIFLTLSSILSERFFQYFFAKTMEHKGFKVELIDNENFEAEYSSLKLKRAGQSNWKLNFALKYYSKYHYLNYFEKTFAFHSEIFDYPSIVNQGLWISEKYFESEKQVVRNYFAELFSRIDTSKIDQCKVWSQTNQTVVLDTLSENALYNQTLDLNYIKKAWEFIKASDSNAELIWLGSNKNRLEESGIQGKFISLDGLSELQIIYMLSQAKHHIVGHELMSWWGAWLKTHPEGKTIRPKQFFNDFRDDSSTIYPENWITLN